MAWNESRGDAGRLGAELAAAALPLADDRDLDPLIERIGDARYVLLGEATHGTSEFYSWRARLSRRLIAEHLESDVVEVYGDGAAAAGTTHARLAERVETSGETVFFYTQDARPLLEALGRGHPKLRTLHRPANLEDLFLKLTGRQIREDG